MKRKIPLIIALALVMAFMAIGCNSLSRFKVEGEQDTSYIVLSNGGSAVQYGNYVYFINGYNGYEDVDGKANVFNKVEKGAIYRAELADSGHDVEKRFDLSSGSVTKKTFQPARNSKGLKFETLSGPGKLLGYEQDANGDYLKDKDGEYIEIRDEVIGKENAVVQKIGPKKIGTTGFADGGIFIFDDYIFYASPNNTKNRSGDVQTGKTDFFRAKLDGSKTELIYTTENISNSSEYMFYKYSGSYYLVSHDGDKVVSVEMSNKKIGKPVTIGEGVIDVHFPNKGTYYTGMPENTADDLVYLVRNPVRTDDYSDTTLLGNVLEVKRPDGSNSEVIAAGGKTNTILGAHNGMFFYQVGNTVFYTNLAWMLDISNSVAKHFNFNVSSYSSFKCINPNPLNAEDVYLLAASEGRLLLVDVMGNERVLNNAESTIVAIDGSYVYFTAGVYENGTTANKLLRVNFSIEGAEPEAILSTDTVNNTATFQYDVLNDFVMYFADVDSDAKNYAFFKDLLDVSADGVFIGYRIDTDTIPEDNLYPPEEE